jgi:hypothetical protein
VGHASIDNLTSLAIETTFPSDEAGRPLLVVLAQATYAIAPRGPLMLADAQVAPSLAGELWGADPATSCFRIEPAFAFTKLATDVALVGHAQSLRGPVAELLVTFRIGALAKTVRVFGDRVFARAGNAIAATRPQPFERMPLSYERAFGGWDRSSPDLSAHVFERQNPIGIGFVAPNAPFRDGTALPNLEDPEMPLHAYGQRVLPAGFGFVSPDWMPRAAFAGTYDEAWQRQRMPRLPVDFDRRFFNAGARGLVANGYLKGNEAVVVEGASASGRLAFNLPGTPPPDVRVALTTGPDREVAMQLDTVVIDTDADRVLLLYRGNTVLRDGPHDVRSIEIGSEAMARASAGETTWP